MSSQPIEANVVLTADTSGYNSSINQSAANTDQFGKSVDSLTQKIERLTKSAGRKLIGFAAADVAGITAATAAYGAFERQMTSLSAQAAILNRNMDSQKATFSSYTNSVDNLRSTFGTTTNEAAQLVQTLSKVQDNTISIDKLATTFTKLGLATQESSVNLAQSMTQLQRSMGTPQRDTERYANQLAVLSANSNASATSILTFANQLAPVGRMVNMSQSDIMGISKAFLSAGQDGFQAANVFSKMMTDVAYASQSGSPDLAKYANLVGMTVGQFKQLGGTDQFLRIFDSINQQGPRAITTLNRMGLDGMRTVRTVTAMAQQSGGLQQALDQAQGADPNALDRGSGAAMDTMVEKLAKVRSELNMTAEAFGKNFAGPAKFLIDILDKITAGINNLVSGPLGKLAFGVAAVAAPFAALAGVILTASKALVAFSAINAATRNAATFGFREGRAGFGAIGQEGVPLGPQGRNIAKDGNFIARAMYSGGSLAGRILPGGVSAGESAAEKAGAGLISRTAGYGAAGTGYLAGQAARLAAYQFSPLTLHGLDDPTNRDPFFHARTVQEAAKNGYTAMAGPMSGFGNRQMEALRNRFGLHPEEAASKDAVTGAAKSTNDFTDSVKKATKGMGEAEKASMSFGQGVRTGLSNTMKGVGALGLNMASATAGGGLMAGRGMGMAAKGLGGLFMDNPVMMGMLGLMGGGALLGAITKPVGTVSAPDNSGILAPYQQAGGITGPSTFTPLRTAQQGNRSVGAAMTISGNDVRAAQDSGYKMSNTQIKGKTQAEALTMLAPQFKTIQHNSKSLSALALDLTHQYGATTAQQMLNTLAAGQGFQPAALVSAGVNEPAGGNFLHRLTGHPDLTKVSNDFANLFGAYQDQTDLIKNPLAAARLQRRQFGQALFQVGRQGGIDLNPYTGRNQLGQLETTDENGSVRSAFMKNLFGSIGVNLTDSQSRRLRTDPYAKSGSAATRDLLSQVFAKGAPDDLQNEVLSHFKLNQGLTGRAAINAVTGAMGGSNLAPEGRPVAQMIAGVSGGGVFDSHAVRYAVGHDQNVNAQIGAVNEMLAKLTDAGKSAPQITKIMGDIQATVGDANNPNYQLAAAAQAQSQRYLGYRLPTMSRTAGFGLEAQQFQSAMSVNPGDPNQQQNQQAAADLFAQQVESQRQYFVGLLTQQREFNISRSRAEYDFGLQRSRMQENYDLQRSRAEYDFHQQEMYSAQDFYRNRSREEFDYNLSRQHSVEDYHRSMRQGYFDYTLSRKRQEQDFQHSVVEMVKQSALQSLDIYKRTQVQRTISGNYLVFNANEQLKQLQQQEANLNKLRHMGLSTNAIQQLGLTDPNNAQQLARLVGDVASDPDLIKKFNEAVAKRLKAASALVTDQSSEQWIEFNRQYRLARDRGEEDFRRQVDRSNANFQRQLDRQDAEFQRGLDRQGQDYQIGQTRASDQFSKAMARSSQDFSIATSQMTTDFHTQMMRAQKDLERSAETIDGNMSQILEKSVRRLSGHAKQQAETVLKEFQGLRHSTTGVSTDLMKTLAEIFGVKYTAPKAAVMSNQAKKNSSEMADLRNFADGGVTPGFTPGRDVHTFVSPTAGILNLSGGEAIMRPEWTRAVGGPGVVAEMNRAAKNGAMQAFADGGIVSRVSGAQNFARNQVGKPYIWGGVGPSGYDCSGFMSAITNFLRGLPVHHRVGSTGTFPWPGFQPGPGMFTIGSTNSYAGGVGHMAGTLNGLNVESRGGQGPLVGVAARGYRDPGFNQVYHLGEGGNFGYGGSPAAGLNNILQTIYPKVEAAAQMDQLRILKPGQMSGIINAMALASYRKMIGKYGDPHLSGMGGIASILQSMGDSGAGPGSKVGTSVSAAMNDGQRLAAGMGWTGGNWTALAELWNRESGWRWNADNPTSSAYGIPQALPGSKMGSAGADWRSNPDTQIRWGLSYIKSRYGSPMAAWEHETSHGWYGDGGVFSSPQRIGVGERGPEMVMPLNDRGTEFLLNLMKRTMAGNDAWQRNTYGFVQPATVHNQHNYQIDRSTTFSGPITVQANDPNMMIAQLKARARTSALTNAAKGGVKVA